ncbi:terminase gpA endonuclease subunit [Ochrobactrum chromiisoli]|uniref:Phage terminase large subunit family protein n=1 Tax=Ochrobactrum chromiisoli TaxID=2993941 RepID=A0ABT3QKV8_9HYPH|nr:terminase gpA endonuclease subunit [Ochrobactrum chromiisoli]MCX2696234.1 phage terminase large subunit family protein [Ochrobactrum chromiisoli]
MLNESLFEQLDLSESAIIFDEALDDLRNDVLQIPPFKDPVEWIFDSIELPKQATFRPGNMRLNGFQRPVALDALDPEVDQITVLKGVQVGWSSFLKAMLFYGISYLALKAILTQPTDDDAKGYYKDQIEPHFNDVLSGIRRYPSRGEVQDTWDEHRFNNGSQLYFRGAASDDAFRRISAQWMMADEVDADAWLPRSEKKSQADKLALYRDRGTAFIDSKLWVGSTPLSRDTSLVWREWLLSDQRRLHVACPHCGASQYLKWGTAKTDYGFRWNMNEHGHVTEAWYQCEAEGCRIDEHHKEDIVENGEFIPTAIPNRPGHRGYHWPAWHSSAPKARWTILAQQWLDAQGDTELLKRFINNVLAEPWDDLGGEAIDTDSLKSLRIPYRAEVPDDVVVLTLGGDTQTNKEGLKGGDHDSIASREVSVVGWNKKRMPRLILHKVILGEPGDADADDELDEIINRRFKKADGTEMKISASAIDLGGTYGDQTKAFAKSRSTKRVWAVKGNNIAKGKRSTSVWPRKVSRSTRNGSSWYMVDTQLAKDAIGRMLAIRGPGSATFPADIPDSYFDGLSAEKLHIDKKGLRHWQRKKSSQTGEEWDCLVYAYAALCGLQASVREYRNLNLAAKRLGIEDVLPPHDPETGELLDDASDVSLSTASNKQRTKGEQTTEIPQRRGAEETQDEEPKEVPKPVIKRKKKGGRVVSSTARRW